ncbi:50S ribosomal protein L32 [Patescibacteria group bacterium]|nr:50S ribosomal protein L32 [Patescibacteria group bacterium]
MATPKKRTTSGSRDQRRMHIHLKTPGITTCTKCGKPVLGHTVCHNCGYYKGVEIIDVMKKLTKKEKKMKAKEIEAKGSEEKKSEPLTMDNLSK